jgi:hypothetical protein
MILAPNILVRSRRRTRRLFSYMWQIVAVKMAMSQLTPHTQH